MCESLSGVEIPLITITDKNYENEKNVIVISGRIHPGESNGSWMVQVYLSMNLKGLLDFLVG